MDQFAIFIRICLLLLGGGAFIGLYFFFLPKALIRRLAASIGLEGANFQSPLFSSEKPFFVKGTKEGYSIQCWVMRYHLFPVLEIHLSPERGDNPDGVCFLEKYNDYFRRRRDKKELADRVNSIYVNETANRRLIAAILNPEARDAVQTFIAEPVELDIIQNTIMLKYRCLPTYLILFFRQQYVGETVNRIIRLSDDMLTDRHAKLLLETAETETDTDPLILCLMLLFDEKRTDAVTAVFGKYERHPDPVLRAVARCGLRKETRQEIEFLVTHQRERERIFALEHMPVFRLSRDQKIDVLAHSLYNFDSFAPLNRALESLAAIDRGRADTVLCEYLTHKKQKREALGYAERDTVIRHIGRHGYHMCFDFLIDFLRDEYELIKISCMEALASLDDIRAVPFLLPFTRAPYSPDLKAAAKKAIHILQKDIPHDLRGTLAFSQTEERGALSLEEEEKSPADGGDDI